MLRQDGSTPEVLCHGRTRRASRLEREKPPTPGTGAHHEASAKREVLLQTRTPLEGTAEGATPRYARAGVH